MLQLATEESDFNDWLEEKTLVLVDGYEYLVRGKPETLSFSQLRLIP